MITIKQVFALLLLIFILQSCDVTFPKETLIEDTQAFIKKETNVDTSVSVYGTTLYLDVVFEDLTTNDSNKIIDIYKKLQDIVSAITRVPLSSNKDINIVVISAFDSQYKVLLRIFVNIDDIKKVSHSYISRTDYFERQLMEFETEELAKQAIENKYDISLEEYIARLSISRTTNSSLGEKPNLRFSNYTIDTLFFKAKNIQDAKTIMSIKETLKQELVKNLQKYKIYSIKKATVLDEKNNIIFTINLSTLL